MFCMQCGAKLPDGAKFCMSCGVKLGEVVVENNNSTVNKLGPEIITDDFDIELPPPIELTVAKVDRLTLIEMIEDRAFIKLQRSSDYPKYFHPCDNDFKDRSDRDQYEKLRRVYKHAENAGELFLFYYDNTIMSTCKESYLLTNKGIHFTSERYQSGFIAYSDIVDMHVETIKFLPNIVINDRFYLPMRFMTDFAYEICDDIVNIIIPMMKNFI